MEGGEFALRTSHIAVVYSVRIDIGANNPRLGYSLRLRALAEPCPTTWHIEVYESTMGTTQEAVAEIAAIDVLSNDGPRSSHLLRQRALAAPRPGLRNIESRDYALASSHAPAKSWAKNNHHGNSDAPRHVSSLSREIFDISPTSALVVLQGRTYFFSIKSFLRQVAVG
jgi:hypothetical protein